MPRNNLTCEQKAFIRENAELGGNALAKLLEVDRAQIYQLATDEKFSVKKGGKVSKRDAVISEYKRGYSFWPKNYRHYKKVLVERDGLRCHYCDVLMTYRDAQVDHVLAKARGGTDAPTNLVLACFRCNGLKSTLCYTCPEFRKAIEL
jgi:5-methylcytosine-specific restriction endonuclease McrA